MDNYTPLKNQYLVDYILLDKDTVVLSFAPSTTRSNHNLVLQKRWNKTLIDTCNFFGLPMTAATNPFVDKLESVYFFPYYFPLTMYNGRVYASFIPYLTDSMEWVKAQNPFLLYGISFVSSQRKIEPICSSFLSENLTSILRNLPESFALINGGFIYRNSLFYGYAFDQNIYSIELTNNAVDTLNSGQYQSLEKLLTNAKRSHITNSDFDTDKLFRFGKFVPSLDSTTIFRLNRVSVVGGNEKEVGTQIQMIQTIPLSRESNYKQGFVFIPGGYTDHILVPIQNGVILYNKSESLSLGKIVLDVFEFTESVKTQSFQDALKLYREMAD